MQDLREIRLLSIKMVMDNVAFNNTSMEVKLREAEKIAGFIERGKVPESVIQGATYPG